MEDDKMEDKTLVMIGIDPVIRDRLKAHAANIRKSMKEIVENVVLKYLAGEEK